MKVLRSGLLAGVLAACVAVVGAEPVAAAPLVPPSIDTGFVNGNVVEVQQRIIRRGGPGRIQQGGRMYRGGGGGGNWGNGPGRWQGGNRNQWRHGGKWNGGGNWHGGGKYWRRGGGNWGGGGYWGGGWGGYDNYWVPGAAFLSGVIIAGALANDYPPDYYGRRYYAGADAHIQWCYNRYRSYRASDNTFQPYNGPRRQCRSPY